MKVSTTTTRHRRSRVCVTLSALTLGLLGTMATSAAGQPGSSGPVHAASVTVHISNSTRPALRDCYHDTSGKPKKQPQPSSKCAFRRFVELGKAVTLVCQHKGEKIGDDSYWDYINDPGHGYGYVTDEYVRTNATAPPYRDNRVPICDY